MLLPGLKCPFLEAATCTRPDRGQISPKERGVAVARWRQQPRRAGEFKGQRDISPVMSVPESTTSAWADALRVAAQALALLWTFWWSVAK